MSDELSTRDAYGLDLARLQARYSKDPSTRVGAAVLRYNGSVVSVGRNGFPMGIEDAETRLGDRAVKYAITLHAEENAIILAGAEAHADHTIYVWPWAPCAHCAAVIIQAGIKRVVTIDKAVPERWTESMILAAEVFGEADVEVVRVRQDVYELAARLDLSLYD